MNSPPAPLSMSARVSTVSFFVFPLICIGMDKEFDFILAVLMLKMSRQGETDVEAVLLFKYPVLPILSKTGLSLCHSYPFFPLYFFVCFKVPARSGQSFPRCPCFPQPKHNPFCMHSACCLGVIQSISIAFGSFW